MCVCIKSLLGLVKYGITIDLISNIPKRSIFLIERVFLDAKDKGFKDTGWAAHCPFQSLGIN